MLYILFQLLFPLISLLNVAETGKHVNFICSLVADEIYHVRHPADLSPVCHSVIFPGRP